MKGVAKTNTELLVTDDERIAKLHDLLGSRFSNHGQLLLPTFRQYEALSNDGGLQALAKEFCRWLGYKPRHLQIQYGIVTDSSYYTLTTDSININKDYRGHPLVVGGIVAAAVLRFVITHHDYEPDDRFVEVGTVEAGLGLWLINAFQPRRTHSERIYHMLYGNWLQLEGVQLRAMTAGEYLRQFSVFTITNHHFPEEYGRGVSRRSLHMLPSTPSTTRIVPLSEPTATLSHIKAAHALWLRIALLSLTAAAVVISGLAVWDQRSHPSATFEETRDAQSLRTIKASLNSCIQKASEQQSTYDPNDIFMTRQIDATKTRCESLRNQYNEALSQYETSYISQ